MRNRTRGCCLLLVLAFSGCAGENTPVSRPSGHAPYPYTTPTPPRNPTPMDGTYARTVLAGAVGGSGECRRCPPYRLAVGSDLLTLDRGVFEVYQMESGYLSVGHFITDGSEVTFFNDPNCPYDRGAYLINSADGVWSLAVVDDPCAYDGLRERFLMAVPWRRIEPPEGIYTSTDRDLLVLLDGEFTLTSVDGAIAGTATHTSDLIAADGPNCRQELEWSVRRGILQLVTVDPVCRQDWVSWLAESQWARAG